MALEDRIVVFTISSTLPSGDLVISEVIGKGPKPTDAIREVMNRFGYWTEVYYTFVNEATGMRADGTVYNDNLL